jgi:hypothetical protein
VIQRKGPWRHLEAVESATLTWVDWFNTRRLLEPIGYVPPAEYEANNPPGVLLHIDQTFCFRFVNPGAGADPEILGTSPPFV